MRTVYWIFILIPLCSLAVYFIFNQQNSQLKFAEVANPKFNSFMENAHVVKYDIHGEKNFEAFANQWFYYPQIKQTKLFQPNIILSKSANVSWNIHSKEATLFHQQSGSIEKAKFIKNVEGVYYQLTNTELDLRTEQLNYLPTKDLLSSDKAVSIYHQQNQIDSNGVDIYLLTDKIELHNHVTAKYQN